MTLLQMLVCQGSLEMDGGLMDQSEAVAMASDCGRSGGVLYDRSSILNTMMVADETLQDLKPETNC